MFPKKLATQDELDLSMLKLSTSSTSSSKILFGNDTMYMDSLREAVLSDTMLYSEDLLICEKCVSNLDRVINTLTQETQSRFEKHEMIAHQIQQAMNNKRMSSKDLDNDEESSELVNEVEALEQELLSLQQQHTQIHLEDQQITQEIHMLEREIHELDDNINLGELSYIEDQFSNKFQQKYFELQSLDNEINLFTKGEISILSPIFDKIQINTVGPYTTYPIGQINGMHLSLKTFSKVQVNWSEINAAWAALASYILLAKNILLLFETNLSSMSNPSHATNPPVLIDFPFNTISICPCLTSGLLFNLNRKFLLSPTFHRLHTLRLQEHLTMKILPHFNCIFFFYTQHQIHGDEIIFQRQETITLEGGIEGNNALDKINAETLFFQGIFSLLVSMMYLILRRFDHQHRQSKESIVLSSNNTPLYDEKEAWIILVTDELIIQLRNLFPSSFLYELAISLIMDLPLGLESIEPIKTPDDFVALSKEDSTSDPTNKRPTSHPSTQHHKEKNESDPFIDQKNQLPSTVNELSNYFEQITKQVIQGSRLLTRFEAMDLESKSQIIAQTIDIFVNTIESLQGEKGNETSFWNAMKQIVFGQES